jgi:hypothetical protein
MTVDDALQRLVELLTVLIAGGQASAANIWAPRWAPIGSSTRSRSFWRSTRRWPARSPSAAPSTRRVRL